MEMNIELKKVIIENLSHKYELEDSWTEFFDEPSVFTTEDLEWDGYTLFSINEKEEKFYVERGASKMVLIPENHIQFPWVIKVPLIDTETGDDTDYCELEVEKYQYIKKEYPENISKHFAVCGLIGKIADVPVYWMDYYDINDSDNERYSDSLMKELGYESSFYHYSYEEYNDDKNIHYYSKEMKDLNDSPIFLLLNELLPEEEAEQVKIIIETLEINDLHMGNFFLDKEDKILVLTDYSGYDKIKSYGFY